MGIEGRFEKDVDFRCAVIGRWASIEAQADYQGCCSRAAVCAKHTGAACPPAGSPGTPWVVWRWQFDRSVGQACAQQRQRQCTQAFRLMCLQTLSFMRLAYLQNFFKHLGRCGDGWRARHGSAEHHDGQVAWASSSSSPRKCASLCS